METIFVDFSVLDGTEYTPERRELCKERPLAKNLALCPYDRTLLEMTSLNCLLQFRW